MGQAASRRSDSNLNANLKTQKAGIEVDTEVSIEVGIEAVVYCLNPACPSPENSASANFCQACGSALTLSGRYRAQSLLGEGGFGRTFLASDRRCDRCVIKQLYPNTAGENSFALEAERLRKLGEHPQIPRLIEAIDQAIDPAIPNRPGSNGLSQFLVQQFAPGDNLESRIEKEGPWTQQQVRSLLTSLIPVLQYVHSFDIIHRDIKPANIIVHSAADELAGHGTGHDTDHDKGNASPKMLPMLVDFGAAKWVRHTPAKTVIGSAGYAAPEQSMGQATFASDIYSLGLTCLYLLTSIHPFSLYSAAEDCWVWQDYLPQPIEPRFAQVLDQMVARSLQQRYSSMDEVALDLQFSKNPLRYAPKQLLTQTKDTAQKSIAPFIKDIFQNNGLSNGLQLKKRWRSLSLRSPTKSLARRPQVIVAQQWRQCYRITEPIGVMQAIAASPHMLATAGISGSIRLWHLPSGQLIHTFHKRRLVGDGHTAAVTALQFHPDGRALYSASIDSTIKEWDSTERCLLNTLPTQGWTPTGLLVTADGRQLISPNSDGQIILWDIATLMPVGQLAQHQQSVRAIALSSHLSSHFTGRYIGQPNLLASASDDGTVKLWRYQAQQPQPTLAKTISMGEDTAHTAWFKGAENREGAIAIALHQPNPQSSQLIVATTSGLVQQYEVNPQLDCGIPTKLYQSPHLITALALSWDGYLAIGSEDSVLTLWSLSSGDCVAKLTHDWGIVAVTFSPDGQKLVVASADEIITVWQREPG